MNAVRGLRPIVLASFVLSFVSMLAPAPEVRAEGPAACSAWLTAAEVKAALGLDVETADPVEYSPGFTVCSWTKARPEGEIGVNLSFFQLQAIREGMISAESIPEYFDLQVSSTKETSGTEPEKLEGIGKRAVLFSDDGLWVVMIELNEGFAHVALSPGDITRAQVEAVAKAVASHAKK